VSISENDAGLVGLVDQFFVARRSRKDSLNPVKAYRNHLAIVCEHLAAVRGTSATRPRHELNRKAREPCVRSRPELCRAHIGRSGTETANLCRGR